MNPGWLLLERRCRLLLERRRLVLHAAVTPVHLMQVCTLLLTAAADCSCCHCTHSLPADGPNDEGEMFERPGKLSDKLPAPYMNEVRWCGVWSAK